MNSRHRCVVEEAAAETTWKASCHIWRPERMECSQHSEFDTAMRAASTGWLVLRGGHLGASGRARSGSRLLLLGRCGFTAKAHRLLCGVEDAAGLRRE